jgi:hypothetical protein
LPRRARSAAPLWDLERVVLIIAVSTVDVVTGC